MSKNCNKCHRPCDNEAFIALKDGSTFHRFCFTCDICQGELPLKFALKNGKYYHTECYANAKATSPKCLKCDSPIIPAEISVVLGNDMRFHSRCFVCDGCGQPLSDRFYSNNNQFFHEECVTCSVCTTNLHGKNFSQLQEGGYICDNCLYNSMRAQGQLAEMNGGPGQMGGYDPNQMGQQPKLQHAGQYDMGQPQMQEAWMPPNQQAFDQNQNQFYQQQQQQQQFGGGMSNGFGAGGAGGGFGGGQQQFGGGAGGYGAASGGAGGAGQWGGSPGSFGQSPGGQQFNSGSFGGGGGYPQNGMKPGMGQPVNMGMGQPGMQKNGGRKLP